MGPSLLLVDFILFVLALYLLKRITTTRPALPFPPGPPGLPLLHNLLDWPYSNEWVTFTEWAHKYGDIVHANLAGTHMFVINSVEVANYFLQVKGANYSDRPSAYLHGDLIGWTNMMVLMNEGPQLRNSRRQLIQGTGGKVLPAHFITIIDKKVHNFLNQLLGENEPGNSLDGHVSALATAIILEITYGYIVDGNQDELVTLAHRVMDDAAQTGRPGAYLVDLIPQIDLLPSWFPGTGYRQEAAKYRRQFDDFKNIPFEYTRKSMLNETSRSSFAGVCLQEENLTAEKEEESKNTAAIMYAGGADTTVSAINSFFLYMTANPEIQAKAQDEIDRVIGSARLPTLSDRENLPYVEAVMSEVLRCGTVVPQGVPHKARRSDVFQGYAIPEGSLLIPNSWFMSRDPRYYNNPEMFDPTRFLGSEPELDPRTYFFGFGRRICPGRVFADNSMYMTFVTTLATVHLLKAKNAHGDEITPIIEYGHSGVVLHVKPFPFRVQARSVQAKLLLATEI